MGCPSLALGLWGGGVRHQCWSHPLLASCFTWVIADFTEYCHLADKLAQSHKVTPQRQDSQQIFLPVKSLLCLLCKLPPPPSDAKLISPFCTMLQNVDLRKCLGAVIALWVHWWEEILLHDWLHNSGMIIENQPWASAHPGQNIYHMMLLMSMIENVFKLLPKLKWCGDHLGKKKKCFSGNL